MNPTLADGLGLVGSALVLGAFAYANWAGSLNKLAFNLANLAGACLLMVSLWISFNLAAFVLEAVWAAVATVGLARALRETKVSA